ncbi:YgiQ family radical SAM protein [Ancylomarina salipaludis]|uniref:YgiQ family radical SAM protein n=1 Tax=Ancylomarina salipaludis TaxID=2501299 RepID=A0A4Q1JML5_9BACT|nr:YgiQ family radical SAM protein [Ancylomarina salipaludis]RXQ95643.1 YgiQ family radical SAM protein [Ancylomarina salipaludis]
MKDEISGRYNQWLPTSAKEVKERGWEELDVILFSGDAYVDHPSFGAAVIGRILENEGLKVAIVPQPNWRDDLRDFKKLGQPRLFFGITAGNMDSMVNHYTANRRLRHDDAYTPEGKHGYRPDKPSIVYSQILKKLYPDTPILLGGIEASLRRVTHYDYWLDELRPSILCDSSADLLVYGMGEKPLKEIVRLLKKGVPFETLKNVPQTSFIAKKGEAYPTKKKWETQVLYSHEECLKDKKKFAGNFRHIEMESNSMMAKKLVQAYKDSEVIVNPPYPVMKEKELDAIFDLPYTRMPHPRYQGKTIPAYEMIKFSVNMHRGCFGGCSFCTISAHQGKFIANRSKKSILKEVEYVTKMPDFKGYLSDLGGPSANMYQMKGIFESICQTCRRPSCIHPNVCPNLNTNHQPMLDIYKEVDKIPGVKKSFIGSGVRYDLMLHKTKDEEVNKANKEYAVELIKNHVSGRLKVAPEHTSDEVLDIMRKPSFKLFYKLKEFFDEINQKEGLNQQLIPYFISSHPGSQGVDMADLAVKTKELDFKLEQVQDFTPTPMTVATVIYYSGYHPYTMQKVFTAKSKQEKLSQRKFLFWYKKEYRNAIKTELINMGKKDLLKKLFGTKA